MFGNNKQKTNQKLHFITLWFLKSHIFVTIRHFYVRSIFSRETNVKQKQNKFLKETNLKEEIESAKNELQNLKIKPDFKENVDLSNLYNCLKI